ncbi:TPA: hypothetical protein HA338_03650 [Methanosarcina acetivorans]|uniref:Uncharacterized protein n=1 Tax=Methanosarcina acetivorans TaxID=2214 RepID=A0A832S8G8_9EURY|nr:hypothetical protein [Methanosarcina acetivorans]HIH93158.1 hypothetical protein [Methanosarcina acetivorans]
MYLNFPGNGHFPGQIGEKSDENQGNFYKQEILQISGIAENYKEKMFSKHAMGME